LRISTTFDTRLHKNYDTNKYVLTHKQYIKLRLVRKREKYFRSRFAPILLRHETSSTLLDVIDGNNVVAV